jgi:cis-L-3-hydroxyproline dehydratase
VRVVRITAYRVQLPFREGDYGTSGGPPSSGFDATVVRLDTDEGLTGWGEQAALGSTYDPAFDAGSRAALPLLAAALLGADPLQTNRAAAAMDRVLKGHAYAKSALDMALWDLAAKSTERPLCEVLGGRFEDAVALYRPVTVANDPAEAADQALAWLERGYRRLQIKVGVDPTIDAARVQAVRTAVGAGVVLFADANTSFDTGAARRFLLALDDPALTIEQPCATLEEHHALRPHLRHPLVLDESIDSLGSLLRAHALGVVDGITIKLARVGGITPARLIRDVAVALHIPVTVEDTGGSEIDTAAIVHLSLSTPERLRVHTVDWPSWVTVSVADGLPAPSEGAISAPAGPGLGVEPRQSVLGEPVFELAA